MNLAVYQIVNIMIYIPLIVLLLDIKQEMLPMKRVVGIVMMRILFIPLIPGFIGVGTTFTQLTRVFSAVVAPTLLLTRIAVHVSFLNRRCFFSELSAKSREINLLMSSKTVQNYKRKVQF